jgi:hypothetical protein
MCSSPIKGPFDPRDRHRLVQGVNEQEAVRRDREKEEKKEQKKDTSSLAFLLDLIKKTVDYVLSRTTGSQGVAFATKKHLQKFKALLETLKKEDRSQDAKFLQDLAATWQNLLEDLLELDKGSGYDKLKALINAIQNYPASAPHTLGYYLSDPSAKSWIPFPFMELIQKIHKDHELNKALSKLSEWVNHIDEIVAHLQVS